MNIANFIGFAPTKDKAIRQAYREVFGTAEGFQVLRDILTHCRFFEAIDPDDRDGLVLQRFASCLILNLAPTIRNANGELDVIPIQEKMLESIINSLKTLQFKEESHD